MFSAKNEKLWGLGTLVAWGIVAVAHFSLSSSPAVTSPTETDGLRLTRSIQAIAEQHRDSVVLLLSTKQSESDESKTDESQDVVGCGIIVDDSGTILTTRRVVDAAESLQACLRDGRRFACVAPRRDDYSSLATLRIENAGKIVAARIGPGRQLTNGDVVVALGMNSKNEVVTGVGRITAAASHNDSGRASYFETDALSALRIEGTPLLSLSGSVVGIAESAAAGAANSKAGRAIALTPSSPWLRDQLAALSVSASNLGIHVEPVSSEVRTRNNLADASGAVITKLLPNTSGTRTGFQVGDVILMFGDRRVRTPNDLCDAVDSLPADIRRPVEIVRDGWRMTLQLSPTAAPTASQ